MTAPRREDKAVEALARLIPGRSFETHDSQTIKDAANRDRNAVATRIVAAIARNEVPGVTLAADREPEPSICRCPVSDGGEHYWNPDTCPDRESDGLRAARDQGLAEYLAAMDQAGGGIYTTDFREGFRHALAMLAAYESDEQIALGRVRPEVREAARMALARRAAHPATEQLGVDND